MNDYDFIFTDKWPSPHQTTKADRFRSKGRSKGESWGERDPPLRAIPLWVVQSGKRYFYIKSLSFIMSVDRDIINDFQ